MMSERVTHAMIAAALIAASVVLVFGRAVSFDFIWDDYLFIVDNDNIKDLSNIPSFFFQSAAELYRPMRTVLYALSYSAFGLNPALYHSFGLALHVAAAFLVYRLIALFIDNKNAALFGALIFAVHPVHIEKTVFITSVFDIPGDLAILAAVYSYAVYRLEDSKRALKFAFFSFALGLLFSETVTAVPFILAAMELTVFSQKEHGRERVVNFAILFVILALYIAMRTYVIGRVGRTPEAVDYWSIQATMQAVYLYYWRLMAVPYPLSPVAPFTVMNSFCVLCLIALAANLSALAIAWRIRKSAPVVALAVFWFYASLLPNSNIIPTGTLMAERYLYVPSVALSMIAAYSYPRRNFLLSVTVYSVVGFFAVLGYLQTGYWQNGETLWKRAITVSPTNVTPYRNLGAWYREQGRKQEAIKLYLEMLSKGVGKEVALSEIAAYAIDDGNYEMAEKHLLTLTRIFPKNKEYASNLAVARCQLGREGWREEAEALLEEHPTAFLYEQVGICHAKSGQREEAMAAFEKALEIKPGSKGVMDKIALLKKEGEK